MDPAKMKVVDLRSELGALGLDTKGNKPALVERLKKALESKTGIALPDTSILDTSTEDADEGTPRRAGPAARTRRRSSSTRVASTPAKQPRKESPEPIIEEKRDRDEQYSPGHESEDPDTDADNPPNKQTANEQSDEHVDKVEETVENVDEKEQEHQNDPEPKPSNEMTDGEGDGSGDGHRDDDAREPVEKMEHDGDDDQHGDDAKGDRDSDRDADDKNEDKRDEKRELTEEEEWEQLNERLRIKEQERIEREKKQAEEDAKLLEEYSNNPTKLNRLRRKHEKKARWSNYYKTIEVTNEVLTPPCEDEFLLKKVKDAVELPIPEPDINENKITLSWYDCDLHQYLDGSLTGCVPLSEGAFAHAWAGTRATHGVLQGRVCYEVRVGAVVTTNESTEKETISSGIRLGWSTDDSTLHLGDGPLSWGYESSGRAVHNSEFKEYGTQLNEKDVVGVYLDLESNPCKISYTVNGAEQGVAYEFDKSSLEDKPLFPHILTKNLCYKVNFGYDKYNMLTKTKIVRNRVEIPIEKVLEEKKALEAELQRQKEEAIRKEKERREKDRIEREERQRKKREEREKLEKERKEKEAEERRSLGEEEKTEEEKEERDKEGETREAGSASETQDHHDVDDREPKENGDKKEESQESAVKSEPMETETPSEQQQEKDVKQEPEGEIPEMTEEQVLKGHHLDKRIKFVIRYTVDEELSGEEACLLPGYVLIAQAHLVPGPRAPPTIAECEVILMVGLPGAGKTHWALNHCAQNKHKRYNILSTTALFDSMKVDCQEFRAKHEGRWDAMVSKCAKCVLRLLEAARGRRRNFILDQTNVYPSAQRRKLREMEGYRRVCVCVVPDEEALRDRRNAQDKQVPDPALQDMKANFALPEVCSWVDEVVYPELDEEAAKRVVEGYRREARAARPERTERTERADRSAERHRDTRRRDDRTHSRDNEDRWGGGGRRWGGPGRGGGAPSGRWGRDRPPMPHGRPDRHWQPPHRGGGGGGDFGRGGGGGDWGSGRGRERGDKRPPAPPPAGTWQRGARPGPRPPTTHQDNRHNNKEGASNQNQNASQQNTNQQQQGWNQWAGGWGGWGGNWNQNQGGWGNWGNWPSWGNTNNQQGAGTGTGAGSGAGAGAGGKQAAGAQQWPANYSAQQWYQWQQWQQQQQQWQGYGQQQQQQPNAQDAQQAWAQYYQNYGGGNAGNANTPAVAQTDKK